MGQIPNTRYTLNLNPTNPLRRHPKSAWNNPDRRPRPDEASPLYFAQDQFIWIHELCDWVHAQTDANFDDLDVKFDTLDRVWAWFRREARQKHIKRTTIKGRYRIKVWSLEIPLAEFTGPKTKAIVLTHN